MSSSSQSSSSLSTSTGIFAFSSSSSSSSMSSLSSSSLSSHSSSSISSSSVSSVSSSSSISTTPNPVAFIFNQWPISTKEHLSSGVQYEVQLSYKGDLSSPFLIHNTIDDKEYFYYNESGDGKRFNGFPSSGLNYPDRGNIVRYQFPKNNIQNFYISKGNILYELSPDCSFIIRSINIGSTDIINLSFDRVNNNLWYLGDNKTVYSIVDDLDREKIKSFSLDDKVLYMKVDSARNAFWQIEKNKIMLSNLSGIEILSIDLPKAIKEVIDVCVLNNTGNIVIVARSDYAPLSGMFLFYYDKSSLTILDAAVNNISQWGSFNAFLGTGTSFIKKLESGVISNVFDLSSFNITVDCVISRAKSHIYVLDRNKLLLHSIDVDDGSVIWSINLPNTNYKSNLKIMDNMDGNFIYFWSDDIVGIVEDGDYRGILKNYLSLSGVGKVDGVLNKRLNSHFWIKHRSL